MARLGLHMSNLEIAIFPKDEEDFDHSPLNDDEIIELIKRDKISLYIDTSFSISNAAWTEKVLEPESYDIRKSFELIAPTEFEIEIESLKDEINKWDENE